MDKKEFIKEVNDCFSDSVTIVTTEGNFSIDEASNYVGGKKGTYISDLLGNVSYPSLDSISTAMYDYIKNDLKAEIEEVDIAM